MQQYSQTCTASFLTQFTPIRVRFYRYSYMEGPPPGFAHKQLSTVQYRLLRYPPTASQPPFACTSKPARPPISTLNINTPRVKIVERTRETMNGAEGIADKRLSVVDGKWEPAQLAAHLEQAQRQRNAKAITLTGLEGGACCRLLISYPWICFQ